jgi:hypothetical protein
LPTSDFDKLHALIDGKGDRAVRIEKKVLRALLLDHSRALARLNNVGVPFVEPEFEEQYRSNQRVRDADRDSS